MMNKFKRIFRYELPLHFLQSVMNIFPDNVLFMRIRGFCISPFFKSCGSNFKVGRRCTFVDSYLMTIGDDVYIATGAWVLATGGINLHSEVMIGPHTIITTSNHTRHNGSFRYGQASLSEVEIKQGAWIGANCIVLAGTCIAEGTALAAGSVINCKTSANSLYAGSPAKFKKLYYD